MGNTLAVLLLCSLACMPVALFLLCASEFGVRRAERAVPVVFAVSALLLFAGIVFAAVEVLYG